MQPLSQRQQSQTLIDSFVSLFRRSVSHLTLRPQWRQCGETKGTMIVRVCLAEDARGGWEDIWLSEKLESSRQIGELVGTLAAQAASGWPCYSAARPIAPSTFFLLSIGFRCLLAVGITPPRPAHRQPDVLTTLLSLSCARVPACFAFRHVPLSMKRW